MPEAIAKYLQVREMNPMLQATEPFKKYAGYREPTHYPRVSFPLGSAYGAIGMGRSVGGCRFYGERKQKPLVHDPDIRMFNRIQGMVVDHTLSGQEMYDSERYGTPHYSKNIAL